MTTVKQVPVDSVRPHPQNPREGNVDRIVESIQVNGFYGSIVVQESTGYIIVGSHRWQAAQRVGMAKIPAMVLDVDDERALKIMLADNKTSDRASYDNESLELLLRGVMASSDLMGTAWDAQELDKLMASVVDLPDEEEVKELHPVSRAYWLLAAPTDEFAAVESVLAGLPEGVEVASAQS